MSERRKDNKGRLLRAGESQRSDGKYEYKYKDFDGERRSVYSWRLVETDPKIKGKKTDLALRTKEIEVLEKINQGFNIRKANMLLVECIEDYFSTKSFANSTKENYLYYFKKDIKKAPIGRMSVVDIRKSHIKRFYAALSRKGYSDGTIQIIHKILSPSLEMCVEDEIIGKNPASGCCRDYNYQDKKEALTINEQKIFFDEIIRYNRNHDKYRMLFTILIGLACRINELVGLTWKDIDMKNRIVTIDHGLVYRLNDGKFRFYITKDTSKNPERKIPMTEAVYKCFQELQLNRLKNKSKIVIDEYEDFVFVSTAGTPIIPANINKELAKLIKRYEKDTGNDFPQISNHIFRHTGCTNMVEAGMDLNTVMYIMGHKNLKLIMKVYDSLSFERVQRQMKKLDQMEKEFDRSENVM